MTTAIKPTETQRTILAAFGLAVDGGLSWCPGAFASDGMAVAIEGLPNKPEVNAILKRVGFRWNADDRRWQGRDATQAQADVLAALDAIKDRCGFRITAGWAADQW